MSDLEIHLEGRATYKGNRIILAGQDITAHLRNITIQAGVNNDVPKVTIELANPEVFGNLPDALVEVMSAPRDDGLADPTPDCAMRGGAGYFQGPDNTEPDLCPECDGTGYRL